MDLTNCTIDETAIHGEGESATPAKDVFCSHWDKAVIALEAIHNLVKNPLVKIIISAVIGLGNALKSRFCS